MVVAFLVLDAAIYDALCFGASPSSRPSVFFFPLIYSYLFRLAGVGQMPNFQPENACSWFLVSKLVYM
jgi:hypothetical protein